MRRVPLLVTLLAARPFKWRHSTALLVAFSTMSVLACGGDDTTGPQTGSGTPNVASVVVTPGSATLASLGETVQLTASAQDANGNGISDKPFTWSSSDETIATVSASGEVTSVANGSVTITATTDGVSGPAAIQVDQGAAEASRILVDASHDGGVWWFPQVGPFSASAPHQGKALADYLRSQGFQVDELGRGDTLTDGLLGQYTKVIRAGESGSYRAEELNAYARFLERKTALILLSSHRKIDPRDELAEMLGVTFGGIVDGVVTRVAPHPVTDGVLGVLYRFGAAVTSFDSARVEILGWLDDTVPVMGIVRSSTAKIFFFGDTNTLEWVPQPFVDNLVSWAFR